MGRLNKVQGLEDRFRNLWKKREKLRAAARLCVETLEGRMMLSGNPSVTGSQFIDAVSGGGQRLIFTFNADVGSTLSTSDLLLQDLDNGQRISPDKMSLSFDAGSHLAIFTFPGLSGGILPDGNYRSILRSDGISAGGRSLDGNGDGTGGDDAVFSFSFLRGDVNHDRQVDSTDVSVVTAAIGSDGVGPGDGDVNGDGRVNFADLVALAQHYGKTNALLSEGDANLDGVVNFADLVILAQHYGKAGVGDLDGDGRVTNADVQIVQNMLGHHLPAFSPITASLPYDSGISASDAITNNITVDGAVLMSGAPTSLKVGLDAMPVASFVSALSDLQPGGGFSFTRAQLEQFAGGPLADGAHVLHLTATNSSNQTASSDFSFTLKTTAATPVFALDAASQGSSDHKTTLSNITLIGTADPGAQITVAGGGAATAGADGHFTIGGVTLAAGSNLFVATATDVAGNVSTGNQIIFQLSATQSGGQVALDWDTQALNAIQTDASTPEYASRGLAMMSAAMYDAGNSVDNESASVYVHMRAPAGSSDVAAVAQAAHDVLTYLYPAQKAAFDAQLTIHLTGLGAAARSNGTAVGQQVAAAIIAMRMNDGSTGYVDYTPGSGAGVWQPTYPAYAPAENPQWATLSPFLMNSDSQFRSPGPTSLSSAQWLADYNQVKSLGSFNSTTRTGDQTETAQFWNDPTGTSTPPGHWNMIADVVAQQKNLNLADATRMLAELNLTLGDAAIVAWDDKFAYNFWRPIQAIPVGGGNAALSADPNWRPLINTPPFPEYVSGHSTFSSAAAAVLDSFFGANTSFTVTSTSPGQNGFTRSFSSFDQAAEEAAMSRIYGGIHFGTSVQDGLVAGRALGNFVAGLFADQSDTRAPVVTYVTPQNQAIRANETLSGQVTDNLSGVKTLIGQFDAGAPFAVTVDAAGNFHVPTVLSTSGSADGLHLLHLVATDNAGNVSLSYDLRFTLDTRAPTITVSAPSAGGAGPVTILNFDTLSGTVDGTGSHAVVLSYQFDSQTVHPLTFDGAGAYSQQLDTSLLSGGGHTLHILATDAAGNTAVHDVNVTLASVAPPMVSGISPAAGSTDIGSTYRPEIFFSRPINPATLNGNDFYLTDSTGARLASTIVAAQDGTYAWLFPTLALPGGSRITVTVDGTRIRAADGRYLDAAQTGAAAGSRLDFSFSTVRVTALVGTSLSGIVADPGIDLKPGTKDDFSSGSDKVTGTADDSYKLPIAGVKVSIIGTSLSTFTDANGLFSFPSVPAGDIKLEVDGNTAANPPAGYYFPQMVMDLNIIPGVANSVMSAMQGTGMGNSQPGQSFTTARGVYLPRVESTIFHTVDADTGPVTINVDPGSVPDLTPLQASELHITAQPNSAIGIDGKPMSSFQIGISAVPAALVMDMLPAGVMQHTFDITIQAPGVAVFTKPVSMTMPNIFGAAAGSQLQFLSFDHTTGRLVIEGTMTVSGDGLTVSTDPGTGITHPGWHGQSPPGGCSGPAGPPPDPATPPDSGSPDGGAIPAPPIDQLNFHAPVVIPMVTGDSSATVFPTLTWKAPPMPPDLSNVFAPIPPNSCGPPPRPVSTPDNPLPKLTVNISLDGPMDSYLTANGNLPLASQSFTLEAGTSEVKTLGAIAQSYAQMFGAGGLTTLAGDILDETTLKVQEIREASDGSRVTDEYTYYLSRFVDIADLSDSDLIVDFPNSQPGVDKTIPLDVDGPGNAFTNNVTGDYTVNGGMMTFNPFDDDPNDLGRLVIKAPTGETVGSIGLDGNGLPVQQVYVNVVGMINEFKSLFDAGKMHPSEEAIFGDLDPTDPTHTKYIYNDVKAATFVGSVLATAELKFSGYGPAISFVTQPVSGAIVFDQFSTPAGEPSATAVGRASSVDNSNPASPLFNTASLVANLASYPVVKQTYILSQSLNSQASGTVGIYLDRYISFGPDVGTWTASDLQLTLAKTIAHETGHQLGLNHTNGFDPGNSDIMSQGYDPSGTRVFTITDQAIRVALGLAYTPAGAQNAIAYYVSYAAAVAADPKNADTGIDVIDDDNGSDNTPLHGGYLAVLNAGHSSIVSSLTFPNTTLGGAGSSINIALFNYGDQPVALADLTPLGGNGQFQISGAGAGQIIQPGMFVPATITFTPSTLGLTSARLQIDHSGTGGTINLQMSATGFAASATGVVHQVANNFGGVSIHAAQPSAPQNLASITNYGQTPLLINGIAIAQGAPAFSLTGIPADLGSNPIVLQPGQSYTISGTFAPSTTGLQRAVINVTTNNSAQPILHLGAVGTGLNGLPHAQWGNDYVSIQIAGAQGFNTIRIQSDPAGNFMSFLPPDSNYTISIFDPTTGLIAHGSGHTPVSGKGLDLTWSLVFKTSTATDTDGDGLPDDIEQAIGTNPSKADTDSDGTDDFTAIAQGLDPLGGKALATGILSSVPLQGGANAVVLSGSVNDPSGQTAYVATGYGLAIVNTTKLLSPVVQTQMPLGLASAIAFDPLTSVVALVGNFAGGNGLVFVDVSNPLAPAVIRSIPVHPTHVQIVNGVVCVSVQGAVDAFDESSGALLGSVSVANPIAMGHENTTLYVLDGNTLRAMNVSTHGLVSLGSVQVPFSTQSLVVGSGIAYVGSAEGTGGYGTVNVSDPAHMTLIATPQAVDDLDPHMAFNGSGLGLLTADTLPRSAQLFDVSDPTRTNQLLSSFILPDIPATPSDIAIANGIGYIAEGPGGLVLLNYLSFDTQGVAPTVSITASAVDVDSQTTGTQVIAGTIVPITVTAGDDVQVRHIELLVNGKVVSNRVSFPWDLTLVAAANGGSGPMTIQVRATDTGGNSRLSNLITLQIVPDTQPPTVTSTSPVANSQVTAIPSITVQFSEPLDPALVSLAGMRLVEAGPDRILGTADDIPVNLASFNLLNFNQTLSIAPAGRLTGHQYQLTLDSSVISDLSGNPIAAPFVLRFTNLTAVQAITFGASISDQLTFPGQTQTYTFQGVPGQRVYFDSLSTGPTGVTVNLFTPSGLVPSGGNAASDRGPITLTESGTYSLTFAGSGPFNFRLISDSTLPLLTLGTPVTGTLSSFGSAIYRVQGNAGQRLLFFDHSTPIGDAQNTSWSLLGPAGQVLADTNDSVFSSNLAAGEGDSLFNTLPWDGVYYLVLKSTRSVPTDFSFTVTAPPQNIIPITLNTPTPGSIAQASQSDTYTFQGTAGQRVFVTVYAQSPLVLVYLNGPGGESYFNLTGRGAFGPPTTLLETGTYRVKITGWGATVASGNYLVQVLDLSSDAAIPIDQTIGGRLTPGTAAISYHIDGKAGQHLTLQNLSDPSPADPASFWALYTPTAQFQNYSPLFTGGNTNLDLALPLDGTYDLILQGNNTAADVNYRFRAELTSTVDAGPVTVGSEVNGSFTLPGQSNAYTFTGAAGQMLYFDGIAAGPGFTFKLNGPSGLFPTSGAANQDSGAILLQESGAYTLTLTGNAAGAYRFKLLDAAAAPVVSVGDTVSQTLTSGSSTNLYQISGAAGEHLILQNLSTVDPTDPSSFWTIYNSAGSQLATSHLVSPAGSLDLILPYAGAYYLAVSGQNAGHDVAYRFRVSSPDIATLPLPIGQTIPGNLATTGQQDQYTFTGAAGQKLYFDWLTGSSDITATLLAPSGASLFVTSAQDSGPIVLTQAGTYQLSIQNNSGAPQGAYSFRLLDIAAQPLVPPGTPTVATIDPGASAVIYRIAGSTGQHLLLTPSASAAGVWSLFAPNGQLVVSGSLASPLSALLSASGDYALVLSGNNPAPTSQSFTLAHITSTAITLGTAQSGTLPPSQQTQYTLTLAAPAQLFCENYDPSSSNINYQLTNAGGNVVFSASRNQSSGLGELPAGNYILSVWNSSPAAAGYSFRLSDTIANARPVILGATVSGALITGTAADFYTFTGSAGQLIYFEGLSGSSANFAIIAPNGDTVLGSSADSNAGPIALTQSGVYSVIVNGFGDAPSSYAFKLTDVASLPQISLGATVSDTLTPAQPTALYRLTGSANQALFFNNLSATNPNFDSSTWTLYDSTGNTLGSAPLFYNDGSTPNSFFVTLPSDGVYVLVVSGDPATFPADYDFKVAPPAVNTFPLTLGNTVSGNFTAPGQLAQYTFTGTSGQILLFDGIIGAGGTASLFGPGGLVRSTDLRVDSPPMILPASGAYTLVLDGAGHLGAYSFKLLDVAAQPLLTPDTPASGVLNPGTSSTVFRFTASANTRLTYTSLLPSGTGDPFSTWTIYDASGQTVGVGSLGYNGSALLPGNGTYTLVLQGQNTSTSVAYNFSFSLLPAQTFPLTLGQTSNGTLNPGTRIDQYTFSGTAGQILYFDGIKETSTVYVQLTAPNGDIVFQLVTVDSDRGPFTLPQTGTYTLSIIGINSNSSPYTFRLMDLAAAPLVTLGNTVSGTLGPASTTNIYRISGSAGDLLNLKNLSTLNHNDSISQWNLFDPNGNPIANADLFYADANSDLNVILPATGTYTLALSVYHFASTASYSFVAQHPAATAVTIGNTFSGTITGVGNLNWFTFTGSAGQQLYLDVLSGNFPLTAQLWSATGQNVLFDFFPDDSLPFTLDEAGTYRLALSQLFPQAGFDGSYSFRLLNVASAAPLTLGATVNGTLNPGTSANLYTFTGVAGQRIYFDLLSSNAADSNSRWLLIDPKGQRIANNTFVADGQNNLDATLAANGVYTLVVSGGNSAGNLSYSFSSFTPPVVATALSTSALTSGSLDSAGEIRNYIFDGVTGGMFAYDWIDNTSNFIATLIAPSGETLFQSDNGSSGAFTLSETGGYTLSIQAQNGSDASGDFSFQMLNLQAAPLISMGSTITGTLTPGTSQTAYRINGIAGQELFLSNLSAVSADDSTSSWALYAPDGTQIASSPLVYQSGNRNLQATLDLTGAYTLLLTGGNDSGPVPYQFKAIVSGANVFPLTLGAVTTGQITDPASKDKYTFTAAPGQFVYFQGLSGNFDVTLISPSGANLFSGTTSSQSSLIRLYEAGTYILQIAPGTSQSTGAYSFQLLGATPIQSGDSASGTISGGTGVALYSISGVAGEHLFFNNFSPTDPNDSDSFWSLLDPSGRQINGAPLLIPLGNRRIDQILPTGGTYLLMIDGEHDSGDLSFNFNVNAQPTNIIPLTLDTTVSGNLTQPFQKDYYTFAATAGQTFYLRGISGSSNIDAVVTTPSGINLFNSPINASFGLFTVKETGVYTLRLLPPAFDFNSPAVALGAYSFRLMSSDNAPQITLGQPVAASLATGSDAAIYRITGSAGQRLFFQSQALPNGTWELDQLQYAGINVNVNQPARVFLTGLGGSFEVTLPGDGPYYLFIKGNGSANPVNYAFTVTAPPTNSAVMELGATVNGSLALPGQHDVYTFTGTPGQQLFFDTLLTTASNLTATLFSPSDVQLFNINPNSDLTQFVTLTESGPYRLIIQAPKNSTFTGNYSFRLLDASAAPVAGLNQTVSGNLAPGQSMALYQIAGVAGQQLRLTALGTSTRGTWQLIAPDHSVLDFQSIASNLNANLSLGGNYILLFIGSDPAADVPYGFQVLLV